jgi:integrase/recombinase XerD
VDSVYYNIVRKYNRETGVDAQVKGLCVHSLRATAATNALDNKADIAKVRNGSGTRMFRRRNSTTDGKRGLRIVQLSE